jgi:hypothetical protein
MTWRLSCVFTMMISFWVLNSGTAAGLGGPCRKHGAYFAVVTYPVDLNPETVCFGMYRRRRGKPRR